MKGGGLESSPAETVVERRRWLPDLLLQARGLRGDPQSVGGRTRVRVDHRLLAHGP